MHMGVTVSIVCMPTLDTRMFALGRVEKHGDLVTNEKEGRGVCPQRGCNVSVCEEL